MSDQNNTSVALMDSEGAAKNGKAPDTKITAAKVRSLWESAVDAQRPQMINYWMNRAFLGGNQWVRYDKSRNRVVTATFADESRVRLVDNRLWPSTRTIKAKLLQRELSFEVPPVDADDASTKGAQIAEGVLKDKHRDDNWEALRADNADATWIGGTGGLCVDWDTQKGTPLGDDPMTGKSYATGDLQSAALTIAEMGVEPGARDAECARWWIRCQALPPRQVQDLWKLAKEPAADANAGTEPINQRYAPDDAPAAARNLTEVLTYYERPSNLNPKGTVAVVVGGTIVDGPHPWPFPFKDRLNLVVTRETRVANRWSGDTVLTAAVPVQAAYNAAKSSMVEHLKLAGNARLLIDDDSIDGIVDLSDLPAEIVGYNSKQGAAPGWLAPPNMPQWWVIIADKLAEDIDTILGVHDVSRGDTGTSGATSGVALSILSEQDNTPVNGLSKELAEAWGRFASLVLSIYAVKVTETRTARVGEGTKTPELIPWKGKDFAGQTRAIVPLEAVLPRNRAAQWQVATAMAQQGLLGSPPDPKLFAQIAALPDQESLEEGLDADVAKARRENHELSLGLVQMPAQFDDHAKHIAEHNRFRKSSRYDASPDVLREIIDNHVKAHENMAAGEAGGQVLQNEVHPALAAAPAAHEPLPIPAGPPAPTGLPPTPLMGENSPPEQQPSAPPTGAPLPGAPPPIGGM